MGSVLEMLLWAWIILDSRVRSVLVPEITDGEFINECVREHNRARSSVSPPASNMLYMSWDAGLAITAKAWARHCVFKHNVYLEDVRRVHPTFSSVGENIWMGSQSLFNVTFAVKRWVDEKANYNYQSRTCTDVCGHYTQVVWESSYKVGCAAQLCTEKNVLFVCNYAEGGNIRGQQPYKSQGTACSECKDTCVDNLCCNKKRDSQKRYSWTPDWDPAPVASSQLSDSHHFVTILVARPIALIFTFITAYAVHYCYPDIFCYE
ncbi:GLIPR1-like protein 1 isoform X2 [Lates calcarifer]|uniref:GLIPR1-like protein 1 isoform X2 n=1 Tax=Lates calcarifer TaxID=8187 RepID=A0AAJ8BJ36_LATCA|nr:GLIPR1-like protein 1 isoform X2 [Lates calcarifer]